MSWIQNVSKANIPSRHHFDPGLNSMLIQIADPATSFPVPKQQFKEIHQFEFLDIEEDGLTNDGSGNWTDMSEFAITDEQASELVQLLQHALNNNMNVIVHCHAGLCRSGAVAEVGIMLGFADTETYRLPNMLVKSKMMKALGWAYE